MANKEIFQQNDFGGGLNLREVDHLVKNNELTGGHNFLLDEKGILKKRYGYQYYNQTALGDLIKSIFRYYKSDGTKTFIATSGTKLYHGSNGTFTEVYTGFTSGKEFQFENYNNICYMVNGADKLYKDNGSSVSQIAINISSTNDPKFIAQRYQRLWLAGDSSYPQRLFFSDLGAPETYDSNSIIDVPVRRGDNITQIKTLYDNMVVYTQNDIYMVRGESDPDTYTVENMQIGAGCIAPKTLISVDNNHVFLSRDGLFSFNGATVERLSDPINTIIQDINPTSIEKASAVYWDRKIILSFPASGSSVNDTVIVYDLVSKGWAKWTNINANMFSVWDGVGDTNDLYFCSSEDNRVYRFNRTLNYDLTYEDGADVQTNIDLTAETKNYSLDMPERDKKFKRFRLQAYQSSGDLYMYYKIDNGDYALGGYVDLATGAHTWGEAGLEWGDEGVTWSAGGILDFKIPISAKGKYIKYKFVHNEPSSCEILGFRQFFRRKRAK